MNWAVVIIAICIPLKRLEITSPFGERLHPITHIYSFHNGVDLRAQNDTVYAVADGKVTAEGCDTKLGIFIRLEHRSFESVYGHLKCVFVERGAVVFAGQPIAITGSTGQVTGEHLHFSIKTGGSYTDPLEFLYESIILQQHE